MSFNIIKHLGRPVKVIMPDGTEVLYKENVAIEWKNPNLQYDETPEYSLAQAVNDDLHFCYEVPKHLRLVGTSDFMCTCGSNAVVVNGSNPQISVGAKTRNQVLVCMFWMMHGEHVTTFANVKDWGKKSEILIP